MTARAARAVTPALAAMKLNDAIWGALLLLLAAALLVHVQGFPTIPGQKYGPALMPGVIGVGLAVCGAMLIVRGLAARRVAGASPWVIFGPWTRMPRKVMAFVVAVGVNVVYILVVDRLGFILTSTAYLTALFAVLGVKRARILPIAIVVTLGVHYAFYKLLRVPLPWGVLQSVAW